jgi:hypothetical protein
MIKRVLLIMALIGPITLFSQESESGSGTSDQMKFGVGAAAGFSTGYGLSFRYWPTDWGVQFTTAPYISDNDSRVSVGVTALKSIKDDNRLRLFVYLGNHFMYEKWGGYSWDGYTEDPHVNTTWIIGVGPGFDFTILNKVSFNLMFGIASYSESYSEYENNWMLNMTAEAGLYYKF